MINTHLAAALGPMRAPFLLLVPVCLLLGWAAAVYDGHPVDAVPALVPHMAQHVALTLVTPLLLALGIAIS